MIGVERPAAGLALGQPLLRRGDILEQVLCALAEARTLVGRGGGAGLCRLDGTDRGIDVALERPQCPNGLIERPRHASRRLSAPTLLGLRGRARLDGAPQRLGELDTFGARGGEGSRRLVALARQAEHLAARADVEDHAPRRIDPAPVAGDGEALGHAREIGGIIDQYDGGEHRREPVVARPDERAQRPP